jgi:hypothetical protein
MRNIRRVVSAVIAAIGALAWSAHVDRDLMTAQTRMPLLVTRLFTGADGQTHAETREVTLKNDGRSAAAELSETVRVSGLQFRRTSPAYALDFHPAPTRQYVVTLSGRGEVELGDGTKIPLGPGHILLAEDTTGKGHISRAIGSEDRLSLFIQLADK